jgi:hypothetical protein
VIPKQNRLPLGESGKPVRGNSRCHPKHNAVLLRRNYDFANLECARIFMADPDRWGPGLTAWARLVIGRLQPQRHLWSGAL